MMVRRDLLLSSAMIALGVLTAKAAIYRKALAQDGLAAIEDLLDPSMNAELLRTVEFGSSTYMAIGQYDENSGDLVVIRRPAAGKPVVLEDLRLLPSEAFKESVGKFDVEQFVLPSSDLSLVAPGPVKESASAQLDAKVFVAAKANLGMDSTNAAGTNGGRLACAWAVNKIVNLALGKAIGGGLATANMAKVLLSRHNLVGRDSAPPGSIVISPTKYSGGQPNIGHVGILGEGGLIYSNSSGKGQWVQNFTVRRWTKYYNGTKGLDVLFYRLDDVYF